MKIAILSRSSGLYSTSRLKEAAVERGHEVSVVDYLRCYMEISARRPKVLYRGEEVRPDAVIPRIGATYTFYGAAVVCLDDPNVRAILPQVDRKTLTYGLSSEADASAVEIEVRGFGSSYAMMWRGQRLGKIRLSVPGRHSIYNSLAAVAVVVAVGGAGTGGALPVPALAGGAGGVAQAPLGGGKVLGQGVELGRRQSEGRNAHDRPVERRERELRVGNRRRQRLDERAQRAREIEGRVGRFDAETIREDDRRDRFGGRFDRHDFLWSVVDQNAEVILRQAGDRLRVVVGDRHEDARLAHLRVEICACRQQATAKSDRDRGGHA